MSKEPAPNMKMLKLDPETHKKIDELATWLGVEPGVLVTEAVIAYLHANRDTMSERVQGRLNDFFARLDEEAKPAQTVSWGGAPEGWSLRKEIWGEVGSDT